jgi:uncharacterized protein YjbI with pentapeptide repeats
MTGRLLGVTGAALVVAVALITPVLATATATPASADMVINGCTIVSNPTPSNFTNCPGANLSNASLSGVDLSYANLSGASFASCAVTPSGAECVSADLSGVNLTGANLSGTSFFACPDIPHFGCSAATLQDANLTAANLSNASLAGCNPQFCASVELGGATLTGANLTDVGCATPAPEPPLEVSCLVPTANLFVTTNGTGAVVTWSTPQPLPGATPGPCTPPSGSTFSLGATTVTCQVRDANGDVATGTFTVAVCSTTNSCNLMGSNLSGANLSGASLKSANLSGANLTDADLASTTLTDANLSGANLTFATLTNANLTGTILVPSNQSVTATSQAGATVKWSTPPALAGATPGTCTPASGSTFPLFTTTVTCQVLDAFSDIATGTFQVNVAPTTQFFSRVLVPSNGATLSGANYLDAEASDSPGVTKVVFEVSGGTLSNHVVATATPTIYGWLAQWNTTTVPNGIYTLDSVATDADNNTDTSTPITVTVNNPPPTTSVGVPSNGATLSGSTYLDASASNATSVEFRLFGGIYGYAAPVICTATPTIYGWLCSWNTTTVPNGTYALLSEAFGGGGSTFSAGVSITVHN